MKTVAVVCLCASVLGGRAAQLRDLVSPVTRVVQLLENLSKQIDKEGKVEEGLYESFVCWGKSVVAQKQESNSAAESRMDSLKTYIADLDAGRVELTTERQDLEKEIEELTADLETAKAARQLENKDFGSAKSEMTQAVKALSSAVKVLNEATKDHKGSLMAVKSELSGGISALEAESASLNQAVQLGDRFLTKADSMFLRRLLTGEVPKRNGKMLRKNADFKMSYKARSGKIQDVLSKLHGTFSNNLKEAEAKEKQSQDSFDKLSTSKGAQLTAAQDALTKQEVEGGARGMSKANAQDEVDALTKQVSEDQKFVKQTQDSLEEKKKQWGERSTLRDGELAAISKAVSILYSDDARDNFKKSFKSQGFLFLQEESSSTEATAEATAMFSAAVELKKIARVTGDRRLSGLAALAAECAADPSAKAKFKPVLVAVDKMLAILKSEEQKDLETKQSCEEDRQSDTRTALLAGQDIDEKTDAITKLEGEIKDLATAIASTLGEKAKAKTELDAADKLRTDENAQWQISDKEDQDAATTVKSAKEVLSKYYAESFKAAFVQHQEAPLPPPATWEGGYGGKKGESTGIISVLEMVHADILKDQKKAKAEEDQAQGEFDTFKKNSETQMKELQQAADKQSGTKGSKETARINVIKSRRTQHGELETVMKKMKDLAPNCEYYTVNYKMRVSNRQIEVDGLLKAKAILQGGSFKSL